MSAALCPVHNLPWKVVPAGVNKATGQPYNSFIACPIRECKQKPQNGVTVASATPVQTAIPGVAPAPRQTSKDARYAHCLTFAGRLFQGQGSEAVSEAMELARHLLEGWPE